MIITVTEQAKLKKKKTAGWTADTEKVVKKKQL